MHAAQQALDDRWAMSGLDAFELGIGLSTGPVAAALLGSEERLEYTVVGDTVNLSQRLQDLARPGGTTVLSDATLQGLSTPPPGVDALPEQLVKGRSTPVTAWRLPSPARCRRAGRGAGYPGPPPACALCDGCLTPRR